MNVGAFKKLMAVFGVVQENTEGAIEAVVSHREGALADLILLGDAASGEICVATDTPAIVMFVGDPVTPVIIPRSDLPFTAAKALNYTAEYPQAETAYIFTDSLTDYFDTLNQDIDTRLIPGHTNTSKLYGTAKMSNSNLSQNYNLTVKFQVKQMGSGIWATFDTRVIAVVNQYGYSTEYFEWGSMLPIVAHTAFRVLISHDHPTDIGAGITLYARSGLL